MELPSMVQRSGDMLIVRSVVSGDQLYSNKFSDDEATTSVTKSKKPSNQPPPQNPKYGPNDHLEYQTHRQPNLSPLLLEQQLEMYCAAAVAQKQQYLKQHQQQQAAAASAAAAVMDAVAHQQAMDLKEEGLPQCKIKRNYSCSYCTYFTQNPRYHLTHLRDVHGEKIVINKCKLCLYASRHFQKLVRHMKMVHGCTDGITGANGQSRGKRGMSREVRKRKLEESVGLGVDMDTPTMEQVKNELELQGQKLKREIEAYKQNQTPEQQQLVQSTTDAIYAAAANYERQLQESKTGGGGGLDLAAAHQTSPIHSHSHNNNGNGNGNIFQAPSPTLPNHGSTPSPCGSGSPARSTPNALSYADESAPNSGQNRLVKCSMCDFATVYPGQLVEHEQEEHRKTKFFRCEKCSYVTHIKARFSKHVKYHSMPMIKCVTCDFRTPYKWNLDRHMKNHGGAGPFKCAACDFTADIKQSLTVHEMNHHVPPVGHAAGMSLARRRNKVGGTDLCDDFLSDSAELEEDAFHNNNNNLDDYDESMMLGPDGYPAAEVYGKKFKYEDEEPTDLSQRGGSSDTSSVHNQCIDNAKRNIPDLIPFTKAANSALNLSKDYNSRSSLTEIASMFLTEKALSEIFQPADKSEAAQLSPTTTVASMPSSQMSSRNLMHSKKAPSSVGGGSFFDKFKYSALASGGPNENLICPCGHMAKCLSESIIHRKTCKLAAIAIDDDMEDEDEEHDDTDGRLEIDFTNGDDDDKQSHSALNLSVTGSTRCQHCRHRCKSSADLLNHLKHCSEVGRFDSHDSMSGESNAGRQGMSSSGDSQQLQQHPIENRVSIWNKMPRSIANGSNNMERSQNHESGNASSSGHANSNHHNGGPSTNGSTDENSYYGVETAPGYGEVTKKMTPEEEAANSSLKKVYKCPHCSFWASTASRFHVHIVGHLNKKPFECSLCSYRSNWRWDITKHIRLKTIRDPSHKNARVLMNDETGRRNYTKYNKYITLMKVTEEDGDPKLMKSGEMTPNQVASLSFLNDFNKSGLSPTTVSQLNGLKDDITLEPVMAKKSSNTHSDIDVGEQLSENLIHLPIFATMMNAAMAQQQHQQQQQQKEQDQHATMITPSVTISAVKRSTTSAGTKASDDMIVEVKQEGNEKNTYYSCRKCNFRHGNRDAVLAHIKIHYQDPNYPIVTATPTKMNANYMNKLLAAMCQQTNNNNNNKVQNQHSLLSSGGLLQQAIQGHSNNSNNNERPLSGLALALAGKKSPPTATAGSIIEHGEQKASQNEASAQSATSPSTTSLTHSNGVGTGTGTLAGVTTSTSSSSPSLQHLLTSQRAGPYTTAMHRSDGAGTTNTNYNNNNNAVSVSSSSSINKHHSSTTKAAELETTTTQAEQQQQQPKHSSLGGNHTTSSVTTFTATSKQNMKFGGDAGGGGGSSRTYNNNNGVCDNGGLRGDCVTPLVSPPPSSMTSSLSRFGDINSSDGEFGGVGGIFYGALSSSKHNHNNHNRVNNNQSSLTTTTTTLQAAAADVTSINQYKTNEKSTQNQKTGGSCDARGGPSPSPPLSVSSATASHNGGGNNNHNNNNSSNHNNTINDHHANMLTNDGDRREPSPYRCGHCHQVSNWKHVIQRHCRLKHAGDIRIETLDRSSNNSAPIYRALMGGATNETNNFGLNMKTLQQQLNVNTNTTNNNNNNNNKNNNNNNGGLLKIDNLLNSQLTNNAAIAAALGTIANAVTNGNGNPQDIQAAATYLAALNAGSTGKFNLEDLFLHQQLQQNDQIEVTRLGGGGAGAGSSNLAQLLENNNNNNNNTHNGPLPQNSKCKQQKCPLCPYISESKSQMNYHISLHKPTQYECALCTFVCAKKQHLSSHMRTVHHQQPQSNNNNNNSGTNATAGINLDFSMALQFAAAAKAQQQQQETVPSQMVIDLTSLKNSTGDNTTSTEVADRRVSMISYCPKCPARFPNARAELKEHMKCHGNDGNSTYSCEYCDFAIDYEAVLEVHRYMHTQHYHDKHGGELTPNSKEDNEYPAPKLITQIISANGKGDNPQQKHAEVMWIVDGDLNMDQLKAQQQHASISSSSASSASTVSSLPVSTKFDNANSLLKKQLEAGPVGNLKRNTPTPGESMATDDGVCDDTTSEGGESSNESVASHLDKPMDVDTDDPIEKCMHCPFETKSTAVYKDHLQHHKGISQCDLAFSCDHCDYMDDDKNAIADHTRLHFNGMEKLKSIAFFTTYDKLELSVDETEEEQEGGEQKPDDHAANEEAAVASPPTAHISEDQHVQQIKQEHHNNNNEDDAINENMLQEHLLEKLKAINEVSVKKEPEQLNEKSDDAERPHKPTTKIILYKNEGCLSIKKDVMASSATETEMAPSSDNISDRLRRRISRTTGGGGGGINSGDAAPVEAEPLQEEPQQEQSHKTILVNAKTGQVISKN